MLGTLYLVTVGIVVVALLLRPFLILRPTVWFSLAMLIQINGGAAFATSCGSYGAVDSGYPYAWELRVATLAFPLALFAWVAATPQLSALAGGIYRECRAVDRLPCSFGRPESVTAVWLGLGAAAILSTYLLTVPFWKTGLVAILFDPEHATMAREHSLKLLESGFVRYGYSLYCSVIAPLAAGLMAARKPRSLLSRGVSLVLFAVLLVSVMATGARASAGLILVTAALVLCLKRGIIRSIPCAALLAALALFVALGLTVAREAAAGQCSPTAVLQTFLPAIAERICVTPYLTGVWTNLYAHEHGLLGLTNLRPLAVLSGAEYVNLPNLVGLAYMPHPIRSVSVVTCLLFDFQASFGLAGGWVVAFAALACLDLLLFAFRRLNGGVLVACLAAFMTAQLSLTSSGIFVCLLTHGILPIAAVSTLLGAAWRYRLITRSLHQRLVALRGCSGVVHVPNSDFSNPGGRSCALST